MPVAREMPLLRNHKIELCGKEGKGLSVFEMVGPTKNVGQVCGYTPKQQTHPGFQ
jgi:hypothetical protein